MPTLWPSESHQAERSVRKSHDKGERGVEPSDIVVGKMTDCLADALAPNRHPLVRHNLRPRPQPI